MAECEALVLQATLLEDEDFSFVFGLEKNIFEGNYYDFESNMIFSFVFLVFIWEFFLILF